MFWSQKQIGIFNNSQKQSIIISTGTISHTCLEVSDIKHIVDIPRSICNKKQARQAVQSQPIFIVDGYHYYILDEIDIRQQ